MTSVPPQPVPYDKKATSNAVSREAHFVVSSHMRVSRTNYDVELQQEFDNLGKSFIDDFFSKYGISVESIIKLGQVVSKKFKDRKNITPNDLKDMAVKCSDIILTYLLDNGKIDKAKYQEIHKYIFASDFIASNLLALFDDFATTPIAEQITELAPKVKESCASCFGKEPKQRKRVVHKGVIYKAEK